MNHSQIIKRALQITWRYKVLWLFGILLALTSGGSGGGGGSPSGNVGMPPVSGLERVDPRMIAGVVLLCCCLLLMLIVVGVVVRYVARTALYRGVDQIEATGVAPSWRQGFRLGWSQRAFRLWLLDLVVGIPFVIVALVLLLLGASPLLLLLLESPVAKWTGVALAIGLELLVILFLVIVGVLLNVFGQFWARRIALADEGVGRAISTGYALVRSRGKDVALMWLLLFALGLGFGLLLIVLFFVVMSAAVAVGAGIGFAIHAATGSVGWAVAAGLPPFLLILFVPLIFVQALWLVFESSTWTLTYRQIAAEAEQGEVAVG